MGLKGKKKLAKKHKARTSRPAPSPERSDSSPVDGDRSDEEEIKTEAHWGLTPLIKRIAKLFTENDPQLLPLYLADLAAVQAKSRELLAKSGKYGADSSSGVASIVDLTVCSDEEIAYYDSVQLYLDTWKILSAEGKKLESRSLIEVLQSEDDGCGGGSGDEDLRAGVLEMLIDAGIKISTVMAEYFALYIGPLEDSEIMGRFRVLKNTLMIERLDMDKDKTSPVIDRFVQVLDSAIGKIRDSDKDAKGKPIKLDDGKVLFGRRESELLGLIFSSVLHLEVALCFRTIRDKLDNKDLMSLKSFLAELFEQKLGRLSWNLNEFKKRCETSDDEAISKRTELKEALDSEIKKIWKGLMDLE